MEINPFKEFIAKQAGPDKAERIRKEQAAIDFEEIFARQLVNEMTKNSFEMTNSLAGAGSNSLYREFITDALAGELAGQRKLGMADLVMDYWNQTTDEITKHKTKDLQDE